MLSTPTKPAKLYRECLDRRASPRTAVKGSAMLRISNYKFRHTNPIEISTCGARLVVHEPLEAGQLVEIMVRRSERAFTRWARVAWANPLAGLSTVVGLTFL